MTNDEKREAAWTALVATGLENDGTDEYCAMEWVFGRGFDARLAAVNDLAITRALLEGLEVEYVDDFLQKATPERAKKLGQFITSRIKTDLSQAVLQAAFAAEPPPYQPQTAEPSDGDKSQHEFMMGL